MRYKLNNCKLFFIIRANRLRYAEDEEGHDDPGNQLHQGLVDGPHDSGRQGLRARGGGA